MSGSLQISQGGQEEVGHLLLALWVIHPHTPSCGPMKPFKVLPCFFTLVNMAWKECHYGQNRNIQATGGLMSCADDILWCISDSLTSLANFCGQGRITDLSLGRQCVKCFCFLSLPPSLFCPSQAMATDSWRQLL